MNTLSTSCEQIMNNFSRADCSQTGFINKPISSQTACAPARVKESELELRIGDWSPLIKNPEAYYKAMCEKRWGGNFDLVRAVAADGAAAALGTDGVPPPGRRLS